MSELTPRPFPLRGDSRGWLVPIESGRDVPFAIQRVYFIGGTIPDVRRGLHAHRATRQVAVCAAGACTFVMDDGVQRTEIRLDRRNVGLDIPPMIWHEMYDFTADCVLLVLADAPFDEADYIRDYDEFRRLVNPTPSSRP